MPIQKYAKDGYGQIELNHVAWRRDGRIEAQCYLDKADFNNTDSKAENAMLLAVDKATRTVYKATAANAATLPIGIHYSTEHLYDERQAGGLKYFALTPDADKGQDFLPRIGYPAIGDTITTNLLAYDTANFADDDAFEAMDLTTPQYAGIRDDSGYWVVGPTAPTVGPVARIVEVTTMPDGQFALKLHISKVI